MEEIFQKIKKIAIKIEEAIKKEDLTKSNNVNVTGDTQLKLDILSDKIVEDNLKELSLLKAIVSEEKKEILNLNENGSLIIAYDPLDGSSLVDVNLSVGSIFGIYKDSLKGENLIASSYIVYGPRLEILFCQKGNKPKLYRKKGDKFEFIKDISLNEKGKIIAPGATQKNWLPHHKEYIESIFQEGYRLRYSGGMVPDLHQILLKGGGIFSYPATTDKPKGKLRLFFEVLPFALIFKEANGEALNDKLEDLLTLQSSNIHDTTPCFFGSKYEIEKLKEFYGR